MQLFWKDGAACFLPENERESRALAVIVETLMSGLNTNPDMSANDGSAAADAAIADALTWRPPGTDS